MLAVEYISEETNFKLVVGPTEDVAWPLKYIIARVLDGW